MLLEFAEFFSDLHGTIGERTRLLLVRQFCRYVGNTLQTDKEKHRQWLRRGKARFVRDCGVRESSINATMDVETSALSRMCERWLDTSAFKRAGEDKWRAVTPGSAHVVLAMVDSLKSLSSDGADSTLTIRE